MINEQGDVAIKQTPSPISRAHILNVLHYICPPSSLHAVPHHLLSPPLLHRHHFLSILPDNQADYLIWPPGHPDPILTLLESIKPDDLPDLLVTPDTEFVHPDIHYIADPETVYAYVRITPTTIPQYSYLDARNSLCLIFLWDQNTLSWRYHNSTIGSFPENSHSDLSHAMAPLQCLDDFLGETTYTVATINLGDEDDAYWDAYNAVADNPAPLGCSIKSSTPMDGEDAYWAQYSNVQGSADSTIPSPRPPNGILQSQQSGADQRVFVPSSEFRLPLPRDEFYNPLAPPSPNCLTRKLAGLPNRLDSPLLQDDDPPSASATSPSPQSPQADLVLVGDAFVVLEPASSSDKTVEDAAADEALMQTIRGLYRLWKTSSKSQQRFLALTQLAIEQ